MFWLLGLPFLIVATWQDLKHHEIDDNLAYGMIAIGIACIIMANPLPYDMLMTGLGHVMFLYVALALGWFFQSTGAWKSGDTLVLAAAAFLCAPVDIFVFIGIALAVLLACCVPMLLKKIKYTPGIPAIAVIFIVYNLMVI